MGSQASKCQNCMGYQQLKVLECNHHICKTCIYEKSIIKNGSGHFMCNNCQKKQQMKIDLPTVLFLGTHQAGKTHCLKTIMNGGRMLNSYDKQQTIIQKDWPHQFYYDGFILADMEGYRQTEGTNNRKKKILYTLAYIYQYIQRPNTLFIIFIDPIEKQNYSLEYACKILEQLTKNHISPYRILIAQSKQDIAANQKISRRDIIESIIDYNVDFQQFSVRNNIDVPLLIKKLKDMKNRLTERIMIGPSLRHKVTVFGTISNQIKKFMLQNDINLQFSFHNIDQNYQSWKIKFSQKFCIFIYTSQTHPQIQGLITFYSLNSKFGQKNLVLIGDNSDTSFTSSNNVRFPNYNGLLLQYPLNKKKLLSELRIYWQI